MEHDPNDPRTWRWGLTEEGQHKLHRETRKYRIKLFAWGTAWALVTFGVFIIAVWYWCTAVDPRIVASVPKSAWLCVLLCRIGTYVVYAALPMFLASKIMDLFEPRPPGITLTAFLGEAFNFLNEYRAETGHGFGEQEEAEEALDETDESLPNPEPEGDTECDCST